MQVHIEYTRSVANIRYTFSSTVSMYRRTIHIHLYSVDQSVAGGCGSPTIQTRPHVGLGDVHAEEDARIPHRLVGLYNRLSLVDKV